MVARASLVFRFLLMMLYSAHQYVGLTILVHVTTQAQLDKIVRSMYVSTRIAVPLSWVGLTSRSYGVAAKKTKSAASVTHMPHV